MHWSAAMNVALDPAKRTRLIARRRVCCGDASDLSSYVSGSMADGDRLDIQRGEMAVRKKHAAESGREKSAPGK